MIRSIIFFSVFLLLLSCDTQRIDEQKRKVISLNGQWQIEETEYSKQAPESFSKTVPVPGLIDLAKPNKFDSIGLPTSYDRFFWYRREFQIDEEIPEIAILKIHKVKYTAKIWINGKEVGEHYYNFTPASFDVKSLLKTNGTNEIVIRISTYENSPDSVQSGNDFEKLRYIPGIYDNVELILTGKPFIENVQLVPDIDKEEVRVVSNIVSDKKDVQLQYYVKEYISGNIVATGKSNTNDFKIPIPDCKLWTPENPFLYTIHLNSEEDDLSVRFGMRTFRLDSKSGRAILNGKPYFMRGTNVCILRFFEDPDHGLLPWDSTWVNNLHLKFKTMQWNSIRYCIGFPPEMWYDIADEVGFLIQDEYPVWCLNDKHYEKANPDFSKIHNEYAAWMRERWNHTCVVIWDAQNETKSDETGPALQKVRHMDLSNRPWDNGWGYPMDKNDAQETHPYIYNKMTKLNPFPPEGGVLNEIYDTLRYPDLTNAPYMFFPREDGERHPNPIIINEYGWLWINRDGSPTTLTDKVYQKIFGDMSNEERKYRYARHLAMLTEYWRAHRLCAGVLHFCGLGYSRPEEPRGQTSDNFIDVVSLDFEPNFEEYVGDAFSQIGLMINFWDEKILRNEAKDIEIILINDTYDDWNGKLKLSLFKDGVEKYVTEKDVDIKALGEIKESIRIPFNQKSGKYQLIAEIRYNKEEVQSIRDIEILD